MRTSGRRTGTQKIGFKVVFKASVEFLFFRVEELEVSAVLGILKAVIEGRGKAISGKVSGTAGGLLGSVVG